MYDETERFNMKLWNEGRKFQSENTVNTDITSQEKKVQSNKESVAHVLRTAELYDIGKPRVKANKKQKLRGKYLLFHHTTMVRTDRDARRNMTRTLRLPTFLHHPRRSINVEDGLY